MPRRSLGQEVFHMDHLRNSPSQQHLDPTSRSSISSQPDHDDLDMDMPRAGNAAAAAAAGVGSRGADQLLNGAQRPHKLDLYSIPVFLLECLILAALGYAAYFIHFQYKLQPLLSGFYCDDVSLRQKFTETKFTEQLRRPDNELMGLVLLLVVPLVVIIFCELVNSMFGSLKFRQIRSLCKCCTLHSITRRTLRFSSAYLLGFLIVMISCDILATSAGKLRPYFAQECELIYTNECLSLQPPVTAAAATAQPQLSRARESTLEPPQSLGPFTATSSSLPTNSSLDDATLPSAGGGQSIARPLSQPISSPRSEALDEGGLLRPSGTNGSLSLFKRDTSAAAQVTGQGVIERKWVDLSGANLKELCQFSGDSIQTRMFDSMAMAWPSFPSAVFSYACFYLACYLSFVGTARPFRLLTSVLVMALLMVATIFNVQLVKDHYNHWEDVAGGAALSFVVVMFVLLVYLNKFRDTHYYENQKLYGSAGKRQQQLRRSIMMMSEAASPYKFGGYSNEMVLGQYNLDKIDCSNHHVGGGATAPIVQNGTEPNGGTSSQNDLAMRYFQIPRANYRGAPRPLSSLNRN